VRSSSVCAIIATICHEFDDAKLQRAWIFAAAI
jgi:hypothetical protein